MTELAWEQGVVVTAGEYTDGKSTGKIYMVDFEDNFIEINCGDGFSWRGTSQEFSAQWKKV